MVTARDREAWNSQKLAVLELLQSGHSITQDEVRERMALLTALTAVHRLLMLD